MIDFKQAGFTMVLPIQLHSRENRPVSWTWQGHRKRTANFFRLGFAYLSRIKILAHSYQP